VKYWTNTAASPSRLDERPAFEVDAVLKQLEVPSCGRPDVIRSINNWEVLPDMRIDEHGGLVGPIEFYPVMEMTFRKGNLDFTHTTVAAPGVVAKAKYIGVFCGSRDVHLAFVPKCGNLTSMVKSGGIQHVVVEQEVTSVPAPSMLLLVLLGAFWLLRKYGNK